MANVHVDLGQAKMDMLYETGAGEDGELYEDVHETKRIKIKSITVFALN